MVDERDDPSTDPLDEFDLDDADLDALLEDVGDDVGSADKRHSAAHRVLDAGDLLTDDDLASTRDSLTGSARTRNDDSTTAAFADDDLDIDALLADDDSAGSPDSAGERAADADGDDDTGDLTDRLGGGDGDAVGDDDIDIDDIDDLLGGLDTGDTDGQDDKAFGADDFGVDDGAAAAAAAGPAAGPAAAVVPPGGRERDDGADAKRASGKKRPGRKGAGGADSPKFGAGKRVGKKVGKKAGKSGKSAAAMDRKISAPPKAPRGSVLTFVCSECYTEIDVAADYSDERVTCPDCLHVGKKPDGNFLRTVSLHKSGERKSLVLTVLVGLLMALSFIMLVYVRSAYAIPGFEKDDVQTWTNVLLGVGGLFTIIFMVLLWRFEGNRWEVYF